MYLKVSVLNGEPQIFLTRQGEGPSLGKKATFLRLSLCNLQCHWCDTAFTWNFEKTPFVHRENKKFLKGDVQSKIPIDKLEILIHEKSCDRLVVTGGEPLLQQQELARLLESLKEKSIINVIEIETNGTLLPNELLLNLVDQWNVSVKLKSSKMGSEKSQIPSTIKFFAEHPNSFFKFVLSTEEEKAEVEALVQKFQLSPKKIYLMPEGTSIKELDKRVEWLRPYCKRVGFQITDRLHIRQNIP